MVQTQFLRVLGLLLAKMEEFDGDGVSSGLFQQLGEKIMGKEMKIFKKKPSQKEVEWMKIWNDATSETLRNAYLPDYLHHIAIGDCIEFF